ncbi:uncharacterized protein PHACADRAFT_98987 [Phanerochaete carnosa HHB-10118-sp]|uniref:Major facilitator superfamily (MFS) profile domain-containing protein n=1 Tax=Phanerochaete carnosa (strain HHB-10118-sp) TaxID=650164 RepID=K5WTL2_PHACS|nr:uncharacterized protein PHACADRAFT_98987 [Phanerochaete carnosa HHB-10118-sp]EKM53772.1 hypothetical protein PHACADRAFT_98987 [Phanerochaete carnosa HHB-10118-sp]
MDVKDPDLRTQSHSPDDIRDGIRSEHSSEKQPTTFGVPIAEITLAPIDHGFSAWATVVSSSILGFFVWGFPNSSGALLAAYLQEPLYSSQKHAMSTLPLIGTLSTGILYCSGIVIYPPMYYYPRLRKPYLWSGVFICFPSLLGASFTTNVTLLIFLQGVIYSIGASLVYYPILSYLSEWFVQRRGLASGIVVAADNAGGVLFPIIIPALISRFGIMSTTRIYAVVLAVCLLPAIPFMKARLPESPVHGSTLRSATRSWMHDRRFWFFIVINTLQGFAHFVPLIWLPTFATSLGLTTSQASLTLTLSNATAIIAGFAVGWLSDRCNIWALAFSVLLLSSLATLVLWGVTSFSFAGVLAYAAVYGITAGSWSSLWSGFVRPIALGDPSVATTIINFMMLSRGIGNIASTPISTALQQAKLVVVLGSGATKTGFAVDGGRYTAVIVYTGACFACASAVTILGWFLDKRRDMKRADNVRSN